MQHDLAQRIEAGCVVVTPNRRLAAHLTSEFDRAQVAAGKTAWPSADCVSLNAFLERTWAEITRCSAGAALLSPHQEAVLWERAVSDSPQGAALLHPEAAARAAREAWRIQCAHHIELDRYRSALDEDGQAYLHWSDQYRALLRAGNWLDTVRMPDAIIVARQAGAGLATRALVPYGFDLIAPQHRALFDALARDGWQVSEMAAHPRAGSALRAAYDDREAELAAVAWQVKEALASRPDARIGVVVPDLAAAHSDVLRIFDDALDPARVLGASRERPRPYNVSLGLPLSGHPLVHTALLILELARGDLALEDAGSLLRSPFIAGAEQELAPRALLDRDLRSDGRPVVGLRLLARRARGENPGDLAGCRELAVRLAAWVKLAEAACQGRQPPSQWSTVFQRLLAGLGWPGERTLDSAEYQAFVKWRETVSSLSALDLVAARLGYDDALARLKRIAAETVFQPETPDVPVQVLGVLEANGLEFDRLFVTGLSDEAWPSPPRPNPYLPLALQRAHGVAHATGDWQLEFARRTTSFWLGAAPEVRLSWPRREGERALGMSPLLKSVADAEPALGKVEGLRGAIFASRAIEEIADFAAPELPAGIDVKGGAEFFLNQAACPFRGFAAHRLGAQALDAARVGLDPRDRGGLVHRAAEYLWKELASSARLAAMSGEELKAVVARAVAAAAEIMRKRRPDVMTEAFAELERSRVEALLARLLALEKTRAPFAVMGREEPRPVSVAGVRVETRLDRVDRLEDGSHVVLDYKTSREVDVADWLGERPDEPQLPLYAASGRGELAAVAFAQLNVRQVRFEGLSRTAGVLPGVPTLADSRKASAQYADWKSLLEGWRAVLEALAREYLAGRAEVAPKNYPDTCKHCDFPTLCRVQELKDRGPAAEGENGE
jgi:ATP-dependent helicase/nuclease subunit B